jgi:hypothetical protein
MFQIQLEGSQSFDLSSIDDFPLKTGGNRKKVVLTSIEIIVSVIKHITRSPATFQQFAASVQLLTIMISPT